MATYRDKAVVLKARALRGADRQYVVFTQRHGKVSLIAKGTRRSRSKMSPHMGAAGIVDIMVAKGKRFDRLAGASLVVPNGMLWDSFAKMAYGHAFLAAVDALTKRELPEERIFALAEEFLIAVAAAAHDEGRIAQMFDAAMARLFVILGLAPEIDACVRCRSVLEERSHRFDAVRGGIECPSCAQGDDDGAITAHAIKALRFYRSTPVKSAALLRLPPGIRREISWITERLMVEHADDRYGAARFLKSVSTL